jgi:hypothetical protein
VNCVAKPVGGGGVLGSEKSAGISSLFLRASLPPALSGRGRQEVVRR